MHAQIEGGPTLEFPDGTDPSVIQATVKKVIASQGSAGKAEPKDYTFGERADVAASVASGGVASLAGGIVKATGYAREGVEKFATGHDPGDASAAAAKLEDLLTWQPKTERGKAVMADVAKGLKSFEDWSDRRGEEATRAIAAAGTKAAEVAKSMGAPQSVVDFIDRHKDQVAAAYGSATKTTINAGPLALGGELTKLPGRAGEVAGREVPAAAPAPARPELPTAPATAPAPSPTELSLAPSQPRPTPGPAPVAPGAPPLEAAPTAPRGTPSTIGEGPLPTAPTAAPPPTTPTARAQAYVRDRLGLSWDALGVATRKKLETVAADAQALDRLNPEAVKRQAKLEALRVPIKTTAGRLTRDDAQLIKEEGVAGTRAGQPIRDIDIAANRDLRRNVEVLVERLRGVGASKATATTKEGVGEAVAGRGETPGALTKLQRQARARTKSAYDTARKTEPQAKVAPDPLYDFVRGEPDVINPSTQHIGWLRNWLNKAGIEKIDAEGNVVGSRRPISAIELDDLRRLAGEHSGTGDTPAHYAKQVLIAIDKTFDEGLPESAGKWKAAREAHAAERGEFANQQALDRLVGTKGGHFGTDPKTALEDVWKVSIKSAKLEEIRQLKRSLLSGKDAATRLEGKKALRELRAETARNLLQEITKGVSTNEASETHITAESINRWINSLGGEEKLNVIWGRKATRELMDIREAAQITKTAPTTRVSGSNTFQNILNWMDDTGLGGAIKAVGGGPLTHLIEKGVKAAETPATVRAATRDATAAGERAGQKVQSAQGAKLLRQREEAQRKRPKPPTYGDRE